MLSDALLYSTHHSMQARDFHIFFESIVKKMDWSQPELDVVMDVGCGPGNSVYKMLLPSFPTVKQVVAVDVLPKMIEFAKMHNAHNKIEYHVADIEQRDTVEKWAGQISKIVSIYCFNWLDHQDEAFRNINHILKPGGEAALLFVLSTPFWDSYQDHIANPKWNKYLKDAKPGVPESHYKKLGASHYINILKDIGFYIVLCEEEDRTFRFPDDEDCKASTFYSGLTSYIPDDLKEEFKDELFKGFMKYNGRDSDGKPLFHYKTLTLLIEKPKL